MNIILEGFWGVGKSTLARTLQDKYNYTHIPEPRHQEAEVKPENPTLWYVEAYRRLTQELQNEVYAEPFVMERSILSTMAFTYTHNHDIRVTDEVFRQFKEWYVKSNCLIVFLYADTETMFAHHTAPPYTDKQMIERYQEFYTSVLPYTYDIPVLAINQFVDGERKDTDTMIQNIWDAGFEDRVAQVNVIVFRKTPEGNIQVLILKRNEKKGGFWQTISGGVSYHGALSDNALRELEEEIGITPHKDRLQPVNYHFSFIGKEGYELQEYVYTYHLEDTEEIQLSEEHVEYAFVSLAEAKDTVRFETNANALEHAFG